MLPNIALHKSTEPHWLPRDESKESSLHLLEQQEKEYNARLHSIASLAAPKPLGTLDPPTSHHQQSTSAYDSVSRRTSGTGSGGHTMASTPIATRQHSRSSIHSRASAEEDGSAGGAGGAGAGAGAGGAGSVVARNPYQSRRSGGSSHGHYRRYRSSSSGVRRRRSYDEAVSFENDLEEEMTTGNDTHDSFSSDFP